MNWRLALRYNVSVLSTIFWTAVSSLPAAYSIAIGVYNLCAVWFPSVRDKDYDHWEDVQETDDGIAISGGVLNLLFYTWRPGYHRKVLASGTLSPEAARRRAIVGGLTAIAFGVLWALIFFYVHGVFENVHWPWQSGADDF